MGQQPRLFRQWILHVKVRFSSVVAWYVQEARWHESQKLTAQNDGSIVAEFELDHTEEIKRWILSFGRHAVVLEPEELQAEMLEELDALRELYRPRPAPPAKGGKR